MTVTQIEATVRALVALVEVLADHAADGLSRDDRLTLRAALKGVRDASS